MAEDEKLLRDIRIAIRKLDMARTYAVDATRADDRVSAGAAASAAISHIDGSMNTLSEIEARLAKPT